jgi:hypothetical protein
MLRLQTRAELIVQIETFNDGVSRDDVPSKTLSFLDQSVPNSSNGRTINFVGVVTCGKEIVLFLPKGMKPATTQMQARLLYECISSYERTENVGWKNKPESDISIPLGIKVLEDYKRQGIYSVISKEFSRNFGGKINWAKTIRDVRPFISKSNVPIYAPPVVVRKTPTSDIIVNIHKAIVAEADRQLCWLVSKNGNPVAPHLAKHVLKFSKAKAIGLLRNELARQYEDAKVAQLQLMIDYLQQMALQSEQSGWRLGTTNFQILWEKICAVVFGDQLDKFPIPAVPAYQAEGYRTLRPENAPRPDIVISDHKKIAIIDAKYYDFAKSKPSWADMVKQFFYAKAYGLKYPSKEIKNIFAVPECNDISAKSVVVINTDDVLLDSEFSPINIFYLNVDEVIKLFNKRKKGADLRLSAFESANAN